MSHVYPTLKQKLLGWALLGGAPSDATLWVAGVDPNYIYDSAHDTIADLGANIVMDDGPIPNVTYVNGLVTGDGFTLTGTTISDTMYAVVVYLKWTGGTQLCCFIDESTDASLPVTFDSIAFSVRWNLSGIFQL